MSIIYGQGDIMKRLPNTNISNEILNKLIQNNLLFCGAEGIIVKGNGSTVLKLFYETTKNGASYSMSQNKFKKINLIYRTNIGYITKPLATITCDGKLIGYAMVYDKNNIAYNLTNVSLEDNIAILKKVRAILEYFKSQDIVYADLHARNILINKLNHEVSFCDIDNIMIEDYPMDLICYFLSWYISEEKGDLNNIMAYMANILTYIKINFPDYQYITYSDIISKIRHNPNEIINLLTEKCDREIQYKKVRKITREMASPSNFNGEYIVDYL